MCTFQRTIFFCFCYLPFRPTELKEQLLARSSRVDDMERLKTEFNEQKQEIKEQNEAELESLRRYVCTNRLHVFIYTVFVQISSVNNSVTLYFVHDMSVFSFPLSHKTP